MPDKDASSFDTETGELYLRLLHDSLSELKEPLDIYIGSYADYHILFATNNAEWSNWQAKTMLEWDV